VIDQANTTFQRQLMIQNSFGSLGSIFSATVTMETRITFFCFSVGNYFLYQGLTNNFVK